MSFDFTERAQDIIQSVRFLALAGASRIEIRTPQIEPFVQVFRPTLVLPSRGMRLPPGVRINVDGVDIAEAGPGLGCQEFEVIRVVKRTPEQRGNFGGPVVAEDALLPEWYAEAMYRGFIRSGEGVNENAARQEAIHKAKTAYYHKVGIEPCPR